MICSSYWYVTHYERFVVTQSSHTLLHLQMTVLRTGWQCNTKSSAEQSTWLILSFGFARSLHCASLWSYGFKCDIVVVGVSAYVGHPPTGQKSDSGKNLFWRQIFLLTFYATFITCAVVLHKFYHFKWFGKLHCIMSPWSYKTLYFG